MKFRPVEADSGAIGGSFTHEFHVLAGSGEDAILSCDACDYTSNVEKTEAPRIPPVDHGPAMALRPDHFRTPGILAMEEQAAAFVDARARRHAPAPDLQGLLDGRGPGGGQGATDTSPGGWRWRWSCAATTR